MNSQADRWRERDAYKETDRQTDGKTVSHPVRYDGCPAKSDQTNLTEIPRETMQRTVYMQKVPSLLCRKLQSIGYMTLAVRH